MSWKLRMTTTTTPSSTQSRRNATVQSLLALTIFPDRPDIGYAVKESARNMIKPRASGFQKLRKIGRYLIGKPRLIMRFPWQETLDRIVALTDSDWAGCAQSAKSTSVGGGLFW